MAEDFSKVVSLSEAELQNVFGKKYRQQILLYNYVQDKWANSEYLGQRVAEQGVDTRLAHKLKQIFDKDKIFQDKYNLLASAIMAVHTGMFPGVGGQICNIPFDAEGTAIVGTLLLRDVKSQNILKPVWLGVYDYNKSVHVATMGQFTFLENMCFNPQFRNQMLRAYSR